MQPSTAHHINSLSELREIADTLAERHGVHACFIGHRMVDGVYTKQTALVCFVRKKNRALSLHEPTRIRRRLRYWYGMTHRSVRTDVVEVPDEFQYQVTFNPGDSIGGNGQPIATIGALGRHRTHGKVFVTAGHYARDVGGAGKRVSFTDLATGSRSGAAQIKSFEMRGDIDYALIEANLSQKHLATSDPITTIYQPTLKKDLGRRVFLLARGRFLETRCRAVGARIGPPYVQKTMNSVLLTDEVSLGGDSGGALVDEHMRLWGTLIGALPGRYSIFMPITTLLARQNIQIGG